RTPQRARYQLDAFDAVWIDERIGAHAHVWLDELRERIESGARGDRGRQPISKFWVDERDARQHERAAHARLDAMLWRAKNGVARDLAAGAGGGRHGDHWERSGDDCAAFADAFKEIERLSSIRRDCGNSLGRIDCTAAADRNDDITAGLLRKL